MTNGKTDMPTIDSIDTLVYGTDLAPTFIEMDFGELGFPINFDFTTDIIKGTMKLPFYAKFAYESNYTLNVPLAAHYYDGGAIAVMASKEIIPELVNAYRFEIVRCDALNIEVELVTGNNDLERDILALDGSGKSRFKDNLLTFNNAEVNDEIFEKVLSVLNDKTSEKLGKKTIADIEENVRRITIQQLLEQ